MKSKVNIRVTVDFEVNADDKYTVAAEIEKQALNMATNVAEFGNATVIGETKLSFPTGPKAKKSAK